MVAFLASKLRWSFNAISKIKQSHYVGTIATCSQYCNKITSVSIKNETAIRVTLPTVVFMYCWFLKCSRS